MMLGMSPGYKICASCYVVKESVPASLCLFSDTGANICSLYWQS